MTAFKKFLAILLVSATAYACTKGSDEPIDTGAKGDLNVINAVTDVRAINFYLNGTRQNINSAIFLNGTSGYVNVPIAEQQYQIKEDTTRLQIASIPLTLPKANLRYSLLITGRKGGGNITSIFLDDNDTTSASRNARIRFVQASPGTASYDVYLNDTLRFANQAFKAVSNFINVSQGNKTLRITPAGSNNAVLSANVLLETGSYYTLYTKGVSNGSGTNAFSATLLVTK